MTASVEDEPPFEGSFDQSNAVDKKPWRLSAVAALVISVAVLWLAWLFIWEKDHPAASAARGTLGATAAERLKAVHELEGTGLGDAGVAIPALIACLKDSDAGVRAAAAMAMVPLMSNVHTIADGAKIARAAVSALRESLKDPDAAVRATTARALWSVALVWAGSPQAIDIEGVRESLVASAGDPDPEVRLAAIAGLGALARKVSPPPFETLVASLRDESEKVRLAAIAALGAFAPKVSPPLEALVASLGDESEKNRAAAARALLSFRKDRFRAIPMVVRALEKARPPFRSGYLAFLRGISPPPRETGGNSSAAQERAYLRPVSAPEFSAETVPLLTAALESSDPEARFLAASALAEFREAAQTAIPSLIKSLNEEGARKLEVSTGETVPDLATTFAMALGKVAPESAKARESADGLIKLLRSDNRERRLAAVNALGRFLYDPTIVAELTRSASDRDATVRAASLKAVHDIGHVMPIPADPAPLAAALEDESPLVRVNAAGALGHVSSVVDPYISALVRHADHDTDADVREVCNSVLLSWLKPPAVSVAAVMDLVPWIESQDDSHRRTACEFLSRLGPAASRAVPSLVRALNEPARDQGADDRGTFAEVLGRIGPAASTAVPALIRALRDVSARKQTFTAVRIAAALGKIAPKDATSGEAMAVLVESLDLRLDQHTRTVAAEAIGRFGTAAVVAGPRLIELLKQAKDNPNLDELRRVTARSLGLIAPSTDQADDAVGALIDSLEKRPDQLGAKEVIDALARFGPKATGTIPRVRSLRTKHKIDTDATLTAQKVLAELEKAIQRP